MEERLKNLGRKAAFLSFVSDVVHDFRERARREFPEGVLLVASLVVILAVSGREFFDYEGASGKLYCFRWHSMSNGRGETWLREWTRLPSLTPRAFTPDGTTLLCADSRDTLATLTLDGTGQPADHPVYTRVPIGLGFAVAPDGRTFATIGPDGVLVYTFTRGNAIVARA